MKVLVGTKMDLRNDRDTIDGLWPSRPVTYKEVHFVFMFFDLTTEYSYIHLSFFVSKIGVYVDFSWCVRGSD